jgi:hypothetical protein
VASAAVARVGAGWEVAGREAEAKVEVAREEVSKRRELGCACKFLRDRHTSE